MTNRRRHRLGAIALSLLMAPFGLSCGSVTNPVPVSNGANNGGSSPGNGSGMGQPLPTGNIPATGNGTNGDISANPGNAGGNNSGQTGSNSPSTGPNSSGSVEPLPSFLVTAQIRNESDFRADVTLRFLVDNIVVHLAFARVLPHNITTVKSLQRADILEFSGVDERGAVLSPATLQFGVDFDADRAALYIITGDNQGSITPVEPPAITLLEPAEDVAKTVGSTLDVRWMDSGGGPGSVVRVFLQPVDGDVSTRIPIGPAVGAALDGLNDEITIVLEGVAPGFYNVLGEITDGNTSAGATAPGTVEITADPTNDPPSIKILAPESLMELTEGDSFSIVWQDADDDDNATITFRLESADPVSVGLGPFILTPPIAEDPDTPGGDTFDITLVDVLPGLYDLVAEIDDGELVGTDRVPAVIRVLAAAVNDPPQLDLLEPAGIVETTPGGSFLIRWSDSDANDNAQISLLLDPDPDLGVLDGNEILLTSAISEDGDGEADEIVLGVPAGVPKGDYRVAGLISDGVSEIATWAPGRIALRAAASTNPGPLVFRLIEPSSPVRTRRSLGIPILIEADNLPLDANISFVLTNEPYGGTITATFTPDVLVLNQNTTLRIPPDAVPNGAWPRRFDLEALSSTASNTESSVAPASVWIRQEVEILSVQRINFDCTPGNEPTLGERDFVGLEMTWFGGGFEERENHETVSFWLSDDGTVPQDGRIDSTHVVVLDAPESPNITRTARLSIRRLVGIGSGRGDITIPILVPGLYQLLSATQSPEFGLILGLPMDASIEICLRDSP